MTAKKTLRRKAIVQTPTRAATHDKQRAPFARADRDTDKRLEAAIRDIVMRGFTPLDAAEKHGVIKATILTRLRRRGVRLRTAHEETRHKFLRVMQAGKTTVRQASLDADVTRSTGYRWLQEAGMAPPTPPPCSVRKRGTV